MKRLTELARSPVVRTGARIRARRLDLGLRQADLAEKAGISPSYLNLIEHDKRRIAGRLLGEIAKALDIDAGLLTDGADRTVLDALHQAASDWRDGQAELARVDDLAARYPGWAGLIAAQSTRIAALEARAQVLADRITYDPDLATALHGVISAVTAIRSTASILTSDEKIDADWQRRFHKNIHDDAMRLAADSDALIGYLDPPEDAGNVPLSPLEEVEAFLAETNWHLAELEAGDKAVAAQTRLRKPAQDIMARWVAQYRSDAALIPQDRMIAAVARLGVDPWAIAADLGCDASSVMRRLASLPDATRGTPLGLVICDAGGFPRHLKEVSGFSFPRGTACPLWPVFTVLGQPGRPVMADVTLPGQPETRMTCWAVAEVAPAAHPDMPPMVQATMLVQPDAAPGPGAPLPLGVSCRICPRAACAARREPSALGAGVPQSL